MFSRVPFYSCFFFKYILAQIIADHIFSQSLKTFQTNDFRDGEILNILVSNLQIVCCK